MRGFEAGITLSTDAWTAFLAGESEVEGMVAPPLPDAELQRSFVGASGLAALQEAARFYDAVVNGAPAIGPVLDFGCGWGRIYRLFLRDCADGDLIGVDVDRGCVELCREAMPFGSFVECSPLPWLPLPSASFELVVAYSVFSHLAEEPFLAWIEEFRRLLRPGGHVFFTTLKMAHLDVWERHRDDGWYGLALAAVDFDRADWASHAENGGHLYVPLGGGGVRDPSFYGEAIVSRSYLQRSVARLGFEIAHFEEPVDMPQTLVGLRAI